jgi:hypothetical protein
VGQLRSQLHLYHEEEAVLSAIPYIYNMFNILRKKKSGCCINGVVLSLLGYWEDYFTWNVLLLSQH